jgi:catechol 2,3-dioxygenase-like lactoylglutathione lyase family enzyme
MIQHVTREVTPSQLEECIQFYGVLGFDPVSVPPGIAGRALWLEQAGTQVHLMPREDAKVQSGHIGVVVARYAETIEQLREQGHEVEPRAPHWGSPRVYVHDPAGHLVELMAFPPDASDPAGPPSPAADQPPSA